MTKKQYLVVVAVPLVIIVTIVSILSSAFLETSDERTENIKIEVSYSGSWEGMLYNNEMVHSISGFTKKTIIVFRPEGDEWTLSFEAEKKGPIETGTTDDRIDAMFEEDESLGRLVSFELFEIFGLFPVGACPHVVENLPFYLNDPETIGRHRIRRKGGNRTGETRSPRGDRRYRDRRATAGHRLAAYVGRTVEYICETLG